MSDRIDDLEKTVCQLVQESCTEDEKNGKVYCKLEEKENK